MSIGPKVFKYDISVYRLYLATGNSCRDFTTSEYLQHFRTTTHDNHMFINENMATLNQASALNFLRFNLSTDGQLHTHNTLHKITTNFRSSLFKCSVYQDSFVLTANACYKVAMMIIVYASDNHICLRHFALMFD